MDRPVPVERHCNPKNFDMPFAYKTYIHLVKIIDLLNE